MQQSLQSHFQIKKATTITNTKLTKRVQPDYVDPHALLMCKLQSVFNLPTIPNSVAEARAIRAKSQGKATHSPTKKFRNTRKLIRNDNLKQTQLIVNPSITPSIARPTENARESTIPTHIKNMLESIKNKKHSSSNYISKEAVQYKYSNDTLKIITQISQEGEYIKENVFTHPMKKMAFHEIPSKLLKYGDLISNDNELILPWHYKLLLEMMSYLDLAISLNKAQGKILTFEQIKDTIYSTHKKVFSQKMLSQILSIDSDLYNYKWDKIGNACHLIIDINSNLANESNETGVYISTKVLDLRYSKMKEKLILTTVGHHDRFLRDSKIAIDFDPLKMKTWHHSFNVHGVPQIAELPISKAQNIEPHYDTANIEDPLLKASLEEAIRQTTPVKQECPTLSSDIISMVNH